MKSTYVGCLKDDVNDVQTLVTAMDSDEAMKKAVKKFRTEFGMDFRDEDVEVCVFMKSEID